MPLLEKRLFDLYRKGKITLGAWYELAVKVPAEETIQRIKDEAR